MLRFLEFRSLKLPCYLFFDIAPQWSLWFHIRLLHAYHDQLNVHVDTIIIIPLHHTTDIIEIRNQSYSFHDNFRWLGLAPVILGRSRFFANPLEVIGPHLEKKTRGIFFPLQPQLNIQAQHKSSLVELGATLRAPLLESNKGGLFGAISFCGCSSWWWWCCWLAGCPPLFPSMYIGAAHRLWRTRGAIHHHSQQLE